jgi:hypothetical protein
MLTRKRKHRLLRARKLSSTCPDNTVSKLSNRSTWLQGRKAKSSLSHRSKSVAQTVTSGPAVPPQPWGSPYPSRSPFGGQHELQPAAPSSPACRQDSPIDLCSLSDIAGQNSVINLCSSPTGGQDGELGSLTGSPRYDRQDTPFTGVQDWCGILLDGALQATILSYLINSMTPLDRNNGHGRSHQCQLSANLYRCIHSASSQYSLCNLTSKCT